MQRKTKILEINKRGVLISIAGVAKDGKLTIRGRVILKNYITVF